MRATSFLGDRSVRTDRVTVERVDLNFMGIPLRRVRRGDPDPTPIVFVHGLAASLAFWYSAGAPFFSLLGPCLLYDLRGHGKSDMPAQGYGVSRMTDDLEAVLDRHDISRAHLVAHSFGGLIALLFALRHPERVASLVLADVRLRMIQPTIDIEASQLPHAIRQRLEALGVDVAAVERPDDGVGYLSAVARVEVAAKAEAAGMLRHLFHHPRLFRVKRNAMRWIRLIEETTLAQDIVDMPFEADDLARIDCPVLMLVGGRSTTVPSAQAIARLCPSATLMEIPNVGHFFPIGHPKLFLRPALRFIRLVNRRGTSSSGEAAAAP